MLSFAFISVHIKFVQSVRRPALHLPSPSHSFAPLLHHSPLSSTLNFSSSPALLAIAANTSKSSLKGREARSCEPRKVENGGVWSSIATRKEFWTPVASFTTKP